VLFDGLSGFHLYGSGSNAPSLTVFSSSQMSITFCAALRIDEIRPVNVPSTRWPRAKGPLPSSVRENVYTGFV
jgi:hypothetical protein